MVYKILSSVLPRDIATIVSNYTFYKIKKTRLKKLRNNVNKDIIRLTDDEDLDIDNINVKRIFSNIKFIKNHEKKINKKHRNKIPHIICDLGMMLGKFFKPSKLKDKRYESVAIVGFHSVNMM
jgi:hypothetical protein